MQTPESLLGTLVQHIACGFRVSPPRSSGHPRRPVFRTARGPHRDGGDNAKKMGRWDGGDR